MIHLSTLLQHYKRDDIQAEMLLTAKDREIAVKFADRGFGKRPDTLAYGNDILELAKQGATSFHASEERWKNIMRIDTSMRRQELDELRTGWDLILDIDCHFLEYSKMAADLTIKALKYNDVKSISCKFSGNKGFHIGVPFEAFPEKVAGQDLQLLFPEAARKIAMYIREMIKKPLGDKILEYEKHDFARILEKTGVDESKIKYFSSSKTGGQTEHLNVESFLDIDTILISSRHLYRMVYSFNEKSGLISVPVDPAKVLEFSKEQAKHPVKVSAFRFLDASRTVNGEANKLFVQAFDFSARQEEQEEFRPKREFSIPSTAIPEKFFPLCIQTGLKGLKDGRKRFMFILVNFLVNVGWDYEQIEKLLLEWNKKNHEPLRENYLVGHVRYHKTRKEKILPPNCDNEMYYGFFPACKADAGHAGIKNPVQWAKKRARMANFGPEGEEKPKRRRRKKDEDEM
ncbi:MAG: hypothetical protein QS98_C0014G0034 [archaeon GW2011_AR3]|nr:MAG: hypothetical protein QS98_C0014G0034 [archaeon GW2011_AR3]MBS3109245.1 hypothetical protein [Candidatus Woesearchaeota archaeon]